MDYLKCVESFMHAARLGSFTLAAEKLNITSAMVGKNVKMLEARTGCALIYRTTRRQGLTEAGQLFYQYGEEILTTIHRADSLAQRLNEKVSGTLRISAPVAFGNHVLAPLLAGFLKRYPGVNAEMELSDRRVDLLEERFQLAIRIGPLLDTSLIATPLPPYRIVLAASPAYLRDHGIPGTPEDLTHHNCITFSQWRSDQYWILDGPQGQTKVEIVPRLTVDSGEAIRQVALAGLGIVMHSLVTLKNDLDSGKLCQVLENSSPSPRPMHLVRLSGQPLTPAASALIDYLIRALLPD